MTTIRFRSPVTKPLLPKGTPKPVPPDPRAYDTFRVTQQFNDPDFYHKDGRLHLATDIGNFRCGDPLVAMAPGVVRRVKDSAGALGVVIDHGSGITTEMWHMDGYAGPSLGPVVSGAQVGIVGRTGLGDVCHAHVEAKRDGVRFDPEPLMFGGSITVEDDVMDFGGAELDAIDGVPAFRLDVTSHFRPAPNTAGGSYQVFPPGTTFAAAYTVDGEAVGGNDQWYETRLYVNGKYRLGYVHTSVATRQETPAADCSALENKIAAARTALAGALQPHDAEGRAMAVALEALR